MKERKGCSSAYKRKMLGIEKKECILCAVPAGSCVPLASKRCLAKRVNKLSFTHYDQPPPHPPGSHYPENPFLVARNVCLKMIL